MSSRRRVFSESDLPEGEEEREKEAKRSKAGAALALNAGPKVATLLENEDTRDVAGTHMIHYVTSNCDLTGVVQNLVGSKFPCAAVFDSGSDDYVSLVDVADVVAVVVAMARKLDLNPADFGDMSVLCRSMNNILHLKALDVANASKRNQLHRIEGSRSLLEAVQRMVNYGSHRLMVMSDSPFDDEQPGSTSINGILTQMAVVQYVHRHLDEIKDVAKAPVSSILGRHPKLKRVLSVKLSETALHAFELMVQREVTGLPVLDDDGHVVGCVSMNDIKIIAANPRDLILLYMPVSELLAHIQARNELAVTLAVVCQETDTFGIVIDKLVDSNVHRIFVVNEEKHVCGIITLGDVLAMLLE